MTDAVATEFLEALRAHLGEPELRYVDAPQKLTGGYFTDNRAFRVNASDARWSAPLVLRLFPSVAPVEQVRREAITQQVLAAQGFPAPDVLWCVEDEAVLGRRFFVMPRMPGHSALGGAEIGSVVRSIPWLLFRMPRTLAHVQVELHALDPAPLVDALGDLPLGVDRYLELLHRRVRDGALELAPAIGWLRANRPAPSRAAICHGDLWPGNLLLQRGRVSAVIDFSVSAVAEPALDVAFTAMSLSIAPIEARAPLEGILVAAAQWMCRRFVKAYVRATGVDLSHQSYFEALRCAFELASAVEYRHAIAAGEEWELPIPTWDRAADRMVAYFEARTGIRLELPGRVAPG